MIHLDANDYLLRAGDLSSCGYLIEQGRLEVLIERAAGEHVLAVLGPGEIVGEMALLDNAPRTASVRALETCLLLPMTPEHLAARFAAADPVLRLFMGTILDRFRCTLAQVYGNSPAPSAPMTAERQSALAAAMAELRLQEELQTALEKGEILVHYQPIVRLSDGRLSGFEALARWVHPSRGFVPPSVFVPLTEISGGSAELARICLAHVSRDLILMKSVAARRPLHVESPHVAINISGHDLGNDNFIGTLKKIIAAGGHAPGSVTLELTETALVHSPSEAATRLHEARQSGFLIAVDDFGTGYSSLNYVRTLPIDSLKIDRTFVQSMAECKTTHSIVVSMLNLAKSLHLKVVGEGIETAEQRAILQDLGCEFGQGYLFGRPLPLEQTLTLMRTWRAETPVSAVTCAPAA